MHASISQILTKVIIHQVATSICDICGGYFDVVRAHGIRRVFSVFLGAALSSGDILILQEIFLLEVQDVLLSARRS